MSTFLGENADFLPCMSTAIMNHVLFLDSTSFLHVSSRSAKILPSKLQTDIQEILAASCECSKQIDAVAGHAPWKWAGDEPDRWEIWPLCQVRLNISVFAKGQSMIHAIGLFSEVHHNELLEPNNDLHCVHTSYGQEISH